MKKIESAYIMAAGAGTRMRGSACSKPMIRVGEKYLIQYGLEALEEYGIPHICVVYADPSQDVLELKALFPKVEFCRQEKVTGSLSTLGFVGELAKAPFLLLDADLIVSKKDFAGMLQGILAENGMDAYFAAVKHPRMPGVRCLKIEGGTVRSFQKKGFGEEEEACYQGGMIYVWFHFPAEELAERLAASETSMAEFLTVVVQKYQIGAMFIDTLWDVDTPEEAEQSEKMLMAMGR